MVKNIEATVYLDRIRELAGGITIKGPVRAWAEAAAGDGVWVTGGAAGGPEQPGFAVPGTRTAGGGATVSERGGADGGRERVVDDCGALNATGAGLIGSAHLSSRSRPSRTLRPDVQDGRQRPERFLLDHSELLPQDAPVGLEASLGCGQGQLPGTDGSMGGVLDLVSLVRAGVGPRATD